MLDFVESRLAGRASPCVAETVASRASAGPQINSAINADFTGSFSHPLNAGRAAGSID
jgi:hypothetical protein